VLKANSDVMRPWLGDIFGQNALGKMLCEEQTLALVTSHQYKAFLASTGVSLIVG